MVTAPTLIQQLHGKVDELRRMSDQLRQGDFLRPVIAQANDQSVWIRGPQLAFSGWIQAFDAWMRNQFVGALDAVRLKIEAYVRDFDNAQQAFANGIPGVALPPPPSPVGLTPPGCPYPFQMQVPKGTNPNMNPDLMRKGLANAIGRAKEELHGFSIRLNDILTEPAPVPGAPVVPGAPPLKHLPPDAKEAAGIPKAYEAIGIELDKALRDVLERADAWEKVVEDELPTTTPDLAGAVAGIGASAGAAAAGSHDAVTDVTAVPTSPGAEAPGPLPDTQPEKPPPTPEQVAAAREEGTRLAEEALKNKVLENPAELKKTADALAARKDDPAAEALAAAFVEKFGAKNMVTVSRKLHTWQTGMPMKPKPGEWMRFEEEVPRPKDEDVQSILYAFSATLATATQYDDFNHDVEDDILTTDDELAFSQLLANPDADFNPDFLVKAFERGVKYTLLKEANLTGIGGYGKAEVPLQLMGRKLERDTKLVVLDAISRNPEAAMRIADIEYKPPLTIAMGLRPPVKVNNVVELLYNGGNTTTGYDDKGAALGRFLDAAHAGFCESGDAANAKELVDQTLRGATNDENVEEAQEYLRRIGLRQPVTDEEAEAARAMVEKNSKHPARELLLAETADNLKASAEFVKDAAAASKYAEKTLSETRAAWEVLRKSMVDPNATAEQRADAEKALEQTIANVADGQDLKDEGRRGMADAIALRFGDLAYALYSPIPAPTQGWVNASPGDIHKALAELARDKQARETLMVGVGVYSSKTYQEMAKVLASGKSDTDVMAKFAPEMMTMGKAFCEIVTAVQNAGVKEREEAMALLQRYRFGVDVVFDLVEKIPAVSTAKGAVDSALGQLPGGMAPDYEESIRSGLAKHLSGVDMGNVVARTKEDALTTMSQVDVMVLENMMGSMAREPGLMVNLGVKTVGDWPPFMLKDPAPPADATVDPNSVSAFLRPEYLDSAGGVRLPVPGGPHYEDFQRWYLDPSLDNPLLERATFITAEVRNSMNGCMMKTQWEKALG